MLNNHRGVSGDDEPVEDEEDAEVIISGGSAAIGGKDGATVNPQNPPPGPEATGETAEIKALKIRLALERSAHEERMSREAEFDEARMARELEFERAKLEIRRQLEAGYNAPPNRAGGTGTLPRDVKGLLPVMSNDDPLAFFHIFERTLQLNGVVKTEWAKLLPACLSARATKVYSGLSLAQCQDYEEVKKAVLTSFRLTSKTYRDKFMSMRRTGQESYSIFLRRLTEMQTYFFESKEITTFEQLAAEEVLEQFLASLSPQVREFVESRQPTTPERAAELADLHFETQGQGQRREYGNRKQFDRQSENTATVKPPNQTASQQETGANAAKTWESRQNVKQTPALNTGRRQIRCFNCDGNHKIASCPLINKNGVGNSGIGIPLCFKCGYNHNGNCSQNVIHSEYQYSGFVRSGENRGRDRYISPVVGNVWGTDIVALKSHQCETLGYREMHICRTESWELRVFVHPI